MALHVHGLLHAPIPDYSLLIDIQTENLVQRASTTEQALLLFEISGTGIFMGGLVKGLHLNLVNVVFEAPFVKPLH